MRRARHSAVTTAVAMLLLLLVACAGETPTEPTPGRPGTGTPPPTTAEIVLTVSNDSPLVSSTTMITANVTQNGQPVPNGTAVEFSTTLGTFLDTGTTTTIRTTTNGVATALLTSGEPGTATITARVTNVSRSTTVNFRIEEPPAGPGVATITSVSPTTATPSERPLVTIRGANFQAPVRVLFGTREAAVASVTSDEIRVVAPAIELGPNEQFREVPLVVISQAGTAGEQRATAPSPFRYELQILTPRIHLISPASGPNEGNTRITIFGEGFQAPVRVFFGTGGGTTGPLADQVEVEVLQVTFSQIIAMTPPASGMGAPLANEQVTARVLNVASNLDAVAPNIFRYGPEMRITAVGPTEGSALGGTTVTIYGWGFDSPVAVTIGGIAAQPIRVSGTEVVAVTSAVRIEGCADVTGPIAVTNIEDGTSAEADVDFTYRVPQPTILSVSPSTAIPGQIVSIAVANDIGGIVRFKIGDTSVPGGTPTVSGGIATYTVAVPTTIQPTSCIGPATSPETLDVVFENITTGCTDTLEAGLTVNVPCPPAEASISPQTMNFGSQVTDAGPTASQTVTVTNTGGQTLTITAAALSGVDAAEFVITSSPTTATLAPGASATWQLAFDPSTTGTKSASFSVTTNGGNVSTALTGTGTAPPP